MSRSRQLPLDLPHRPALTRRDFVVSNSNRAAFETACDPTLGKALQLVLTGPAGAGKTHLAAIWAATAGAPVLAADELDEATVGTLIHERAAVIADADRLAGRSAGESLLFHALNLSRAHGARLLITGALAATRWGLVTPDLASRLAALPHVAIGPPDDALLSSILDKLLSDRQISAPDDALRFLLPRMGRSFVAAARIVTELDRRALAERRPITRNLVRDLYRADPDLITATGET